MGTYWEPQKKNFPLPTPLKNKNPEEKELGPPRYILNFFIGYMKKFIVKID
jgi:hypothetical protein